MRTVEELQEALAQYYEAEKRLHEIDSALRADLLESYKSHFIKTLAQNKSIFDKVAATAREAELAETFTPMWEVQAKYNQSVEELKHASEMAIARKVAYASNELTKIKAEKQACISADKKKYEAIAREALRILQEAMPDVGFPTTRRE